MIPASEVKGYTMTCSSELEHNITTLIVQETITKVIETGTYMGNGTTKAVLRGFKLHGFEGNLISIEVNPEYHAQAMYNNRGAKGLDLLNGLSIPKSLIPTSITFDVPANIIVDHTDKDRVKKYTQEIDFEVEDCLLERAVNAFDGKPEMVILDSAGHIGLIEFKYLMSLIGKESFWLILDDTGHVKHYNTLELIKSMPEHTVIWESDPDELHKAAIIKINDR
jgi:hypothetical protein